MQKEFRVSESQHAELRVELFNAFNHTQFLNPNGAVDNRNFGLVGGVRQPRLVQMSLKFVF